MIDYPNWLLNSAIVQEIQKWHDEKLIDAELYERLNARYPIASAKGRIITILITVGAVMVGLGSLLFIAAHWSEISVYGKLSLIFFSIITSHFAGWWFQFKKGNRPKLGAAFFLLGCFFYGSGIWLVSQIFNISGDYAQGLLLWSIGTTATALATGSGMLAVMSTLLIGSWAIANSGSAYDASYSMFNIFTSLLGIVTSIYVSYRVKSPWALASSLVNTAMWLAVCSQLHEFGLIILGIAMFNGYLLHCSKWQFMANPYKYIAVCVTFSSLLALTYDKTDHIGGGAINMLLLAALLGVSAITAYANYLLNKEMAKEAVGSVLIAVFALLIGNLSAELLRIILSNALFLAAIFGILYLSINKLQNAWLLNSAMAFLVLYIFCRYFDTFFSIMDRSLFFVLGGILLMIIGAIAERKRRNLLEAMRA